MAKETAPIDPKTIAVKEPLPEAPPATKTEVAVAHVNVHRPFYIWLPLTCIGVYLAMEAYKSLNGGRSAVDDVPIQSLWNILGIVVTAVLVNNIKPRSFDDIDTTDRTIPWWHVCLDYFTTYLLYFFIWYAVTH